MHPEGELAAARAAGYPGIERAISILRADLERTLRLLGCQTVSRLNPAYVTTPADWHR
jgi:L-lactate dehydrogenase (cytochrome)